MEELGNEQLRPLFDAIDSGGTRFYQPGMSSKERDVTKYVLQGKQAKFVIPDVPVKLSV